MLEVSTLEDIAALQENFEVECKLALGRDGKGALPKDFWESYCAFANSYGGDVFLGVRELPGPRFEAVGIVDIAKVQDELWTSLNNPQKVSVNLLNPPMVEVLNIDAVSVLRVHVPRATRRDRPVYLRGNPMIGTYRRLNSSDCLADKETVRRILAEQVEDSRDTELLSGYGLDDIDMESFTAYRQLYVTRSPDHPWNQADTQTFMSYIGAWRVDRSTGQGGLTRAGLLVFGRLPSIQETFPYYMLDYQERPEAKTEARWVDRLTLDGSWSGNLFDFYRRVIKKMTSDLKVPFALAGDQRQDDTLVHQALREALVNALVHADYSGRASVLIVKRPDMFGFRNPGLMRVPQEIAIIGSESDCRNRLVHQMFRYVGLGEQAGSGIPKIYQGWDSRHWRRPLLYEKDLPSEQTLLELRMLDLLPEKTIIGLRKLFGSGFDQLPHLDRLILATAATEQVVSHSRMAEISTDHAHDLTLAFQRLVKSSHLISNGHGRGTVYHLPGNTLPTADQAFGESVGSLHLGSDDLPESSAHLDGSSAHLENHSEHSERAVEGWLIVKGLAKPLVDNISSVPALTAKDLNALAVLAITKKKLPKAEMEKILLSLCGDYFLTLQVLAGLVGRKPDALRQHYLKPLVDSGRLILAFPTTPTHPHQAYTTQQEEEL